MSCAQGTAVCDDTGGGVWIPPGLIVGLVVAAIVVLAVAVALAVWIRRNVTPRREWTSATSGTASDRNS